MSLAQNDLELRVAQAVTAAPAPAAKTQILIVAQNAGIADALASEMAADDAVEGRIADGSLAAVVDAGRQDWAHVDFVVFEAGADDDADLAAIAHLAGSDDGAPRFVAVSSRAMSETRKQKFLAAGVDEVLILANAGKPAPSSAAQVPARAGGDVTVVLRARGGAGATTMAVNLAMVLGAKAAEGRVALVDLDLQNGSVGLSLDLRDSPDATAFVKGEVAPDADFLDRAMQRHASGVDVLTAPDVFAPLTAVFPDDMTALLESLRARYDHVIIDMPQTIVEWVGPVLSHAARVLVVSDMSVPSIKRSRRLIDLIGEEHMTLPLHVVINQQARPVFRSVAQKEAARLVGRPLNLWIPQDTRAARRATDMGVPLMHGAKRSGAAKAITALAKTLFAQPKKG